ncbi:predicted protein [Phaeodactylum tricornutum CCAP 1055/1]|uniref:Uncharacterized protein n=1 Tax=Phaeodactylum tricornutum (strain CCAP 1055/1) TaxID=556484 RepID=B7GAL7_PHATC|nr:predicted protein [Phaeodactylum tricornutum CCAP 1055/1]EEC44394.1 predicted protein [Phaeodactylum tricornutum CCAP 1055/1]|eukprot:XP_002184216.1 predicted protein [Phaeodactylum tricornutum CCAP 1055/1]
MTFSIPATPIDADAGAPLMKSEAHTPLYDLACMLSIGASVAQGFIILLGGSGLPLDDNGATSSPDMSDSDYNLGFLVLTEGNVVDACFGVDTTSSIGVLDLYSPRNRAKDQAKIVKCILAEAGNSSDAVQRKAVDSYRNAFRVCVRFHEKVAQLNFLTYCFKYHQIMYEANVNVQELFVELQEAIDSAI